MEVYSYCMDEVHDNGSYQITMDDYRLRLVAQEYAKSVMIGAQEAFDRLASVFRGMSEFIKSLDGIKELVEVSEKESLVEKKLKLNKYPDYKNKLQYTSVNVPKKMYHRARGGLR